MDLFHGNKGRHKASVGRLLWLSYHMVLVLVRDLGDVPPTNVSSHVTAKRPEKAVTRSRTECLRGWGGVRFPHILFFTTLLWFSSCWLLFILPFLWVFSTHFHLRLHWVPGITGPKLKWRFWKDGRHSQCIPGEESCQVPLWVLTLNL